MLLLEMKFYKLYVYIHSLQDEINRYRPKLEQLQLSIEHEKQQQQKIMYVGMLPYKNYIKDYLPIIFIF